MELNLELFVKDNPAVAIALVGYYFGIVIALVGVLGKTAVYGLILLFCLGLLVVIRWVADLVLVPGVKISDEIVNQEIPNIGAGLIEAFAYIAASFLIAMMRINHFYPTFTRCVGVARTSTKLSDHRRSYPEPASFA